MMKIVGRIVLFLIVVVAAVLIYAATRPGNFHVERAIAIKAPPEKIFPLIDDLHKWASWSPYEKLAPNMTRTISGADSGKGAAYEWSGNNKAGAGRMEITDAMPPTNVGIKLDFTKPFETQNNVVFTLRPDGDTTNVTWAMDGPMPCIAKVMGIFVNMNTMIGKDFETGLASLKAQAEGAP